MGEVIDITGKRLFTLDEAKSLLPVVRRITRDASERVDRISAQFGHAVDNERRDRLEEEVRGVLDEWQSKLGKLGCETKGIWLVDFDSGEGYYCWHYPEPELCYFHGYSEGFRGRKLLS